jgi:hypothetical protein
MSLKSIKRNKLNKEFIKYMNNKFYMSKKYIFNILLNKL